jgi:hypothetical protein
MMRFLFALALAAAPILAMGGCVPDDLTGFDFQALQPPPPPAEPTGDVLVGTATDGAVRAELFAARGGAHLGYVRLALRLTDGGSPVQDAQIVLRASPADGPAAGSELPVEAPAARAGEDGLFRGAAFLLSPDTTTRAFVVQAEVEVGGEQHDLTFPAEARSDIWMQRAGDLLVSWVDPLRPVVGENPFAVAAHRWTGDAFVPADDLAPDLYPYMDMGGGDGHSTPHSEPRTPGDGRYAWDVDFIMSGGWEMTVYLTPPGENRRAARFIGYTVYEP